MKSIVTEPYITYANHFSLHSIILVISAISFNMYSENSDSEQFYETLYYTVKYKKGKAKMRVNLIQWDLIDMMYHIINHKSTSVRAIKYKEALHLYNLFFDWCQKEEAKDIGRYHNDVLLRVFAFFGEQKRFQDVILSKENFARESYILEVISTKKSSKLKGDYDIKRELENIFDIKIDRLKTALYALVLLFGSYSCCMNIKTPLDIRLHKFITEEERRKLLDYFSLTIDEVRQSRIGRQIFYSKPLIKIDDLYISVNPYLMLFMFENFEYWAIRDKYKEIGTCGFIEDFGIFFENYIEEVIANCVDKTKYRRIEENRNEKRADWLLELEDYTFLVEQKSTISSIKIKQQLTDIKELKKFMQNCWVKAMKQLETTQKALNLKAPIKIILVYDDYYKSECLDEVFKMPDTDIEDDRNYWLVNTAEFEMLLYLYKTDKTLFRKIVEEKINDEKSVSHKGRELEQYFAHNGITKNEYLRKYGILDKYLEIVDVLSKVGDESA